MTAPSSSAQHRTLSLPRRPVDADALGYFRFGALGDGVILTNEAGQWHHLSQDDFAAFLAGTLAEDHADHADLSAKGFFRGTADLGQLADLMRRRKLAVGLGPSLHTLAVRDDAGQALNVATAKAILDHVMLSTAGALTVRLDAREGLMPADTAAFVVQYATEKNRYEGKTLTYELDVHSLDGLQGDLLDLLVSKNFGVRLHTTPHGLSDLAGAGPLHAAWAAKKKAHRVQVVLTIGANPGAAADAVKALTDAGVTTVTVSPALDSAAPDASAFAVYYQDFLAAALASGSLMETTARTIVTRAQRADDPLDTSMRSPSGAGTFELAYDVHGHIFPTPDAIALHRAGDDMFLLGQVGEVSYKETVGHATVRALTMSSLLECLPAFQDRWSTPFCGVDPVAAYRAGGDLFAKAPTSVEANARHAIATSVFGVLTSSDATARDALLAAAG